MHSLEPRRSISVSICEIRWEYCSEREPVWSLLAINSLAQTPDSGCGPVQSRAEIFGTNLHRLVPERLGAFQSPSWLQGGIKPALGIPFSQSQSVTDKQDFSTDLEYKIVLQKVLLEPWPILTADLEGAEARSPTAGNDDFEVRSPGSLSLQRVADIFR